MTPTGRTGSEPQPERDSPTCLSGRTLPRLRRRLGRRQSRSRHQHLPQRLMEPSLSSLPAECVCKSPLPRTALAATDPAGTAESPPARPPEAVNCGNGGFRLFIHGPEQKERRRRAREGLCPPPAGGRRPRRPSAKTLPREVRGSGRPGPGAAALSGTSRVKVRPRFREDDWVLDHEC